MGKTKISWTEQTLNVNTGCTKCSPGCEFCYALKMSHRLACMGQEKYHGVTHITENDIKWTGVVKCWENELEKPLKRKKPTVYFINSMSDLFHPKVPIGIHMGVYETITDDKCQKHTFKILTKRPQRMADYHQSDVVGSLPNLHLGVSICTQEEADEKIPILLQIPSVYRFISFEPLLSRIDTDGLLNSVECTLCDPSECDDVGSPDCRHTGNEPKSPISQIITGCERKHGNIAGRFQEGFIDAAIDLVRQADEAGVKVHVKQIPIDGKVVTDMSRFPKELQRRDT